MWYYQKTATVLRPRRHTAAAAAAAAVPALPVVRTRECILNFLFLLLLLQLVVVVVAEVYTARAHGRRRGQRSAARAARHNYRAPSSS